MWICLLSRVSVIITDGACTGRVCDMGGASLKEFGPVIFASEGFGADVTRNSLLATYRHRGQLSQCNDD